MNVRMNECVCGVTRKREREAWKCVCGVECVMIRSPNKNMVAQDDVRASVAVSLVSCFDFSGGGVVSVDDWERGTSMLGLADADQAVWSRLERQFGSQELGGLDLHRIPERFGLGMSDPTLMHYVIKGLIGSVAALQSTVQGLTGVEELKRTVNALRDLPNTLASTKAQADACTNAVNRLSAKQAATSAGAQARALRRKWRETVSPAFEGWLEVASRQRRHRRTMATRALYLIEPVLAPMGLRLDVSSTH